jgi:hypothetical protein
MTENSHVRCDFPENEKEDDEAAEHELQIRSLGGHLLWRIRRQEKCPDRVSQHSSTEFTEHAQRVIAGGVALR